MSSHLSSKTDLIPVFCVELNLYGFDRVLTRHCIKANVVHKQKANASTDLYLRGHILFTLNLKEELDSDPCVFGLLMFCLHERTKTIFRTVKKQMKNC